MWEEGHNEHKAGSTGTVASQKPGVTVLNLLKNNDRNCLWRGHPVQPYRPFEAPSGVGSLVQLGYLP